MQNRFIIIIITLFLNISCKKENLNYPKSTEIKKEKIVVKVISIDTSYKKNVRLFGDLYYLMPQLEVNKITKWNDNITLAYDNKSVVLGKNFVYKDSLLQEIHLIGDWDDGGTILNLLTVKYGKSKYLENDDVTNETELFVTKILEINDSDSSFGRTKYEKKIHKEVSDKEFQNYLITGLFIGKPVVANSKLHVLQFGSDNFQKIMKDITKDECVRIDVEVAVVKKINSTTRKYCTYIWKNDNKEIRLNYIKRILYSNKKLEDVKDSFGGLTLSYSISKDNADDNLKNKVIEEKVENLEDLQKKSLDDI